MAPVLTNNYHPQDYFEIVQLSELSPWKAVLNACHDNRTLPKILIAVTSKPDHFSRREIIRSTWGSSPNVDSGNIAILFVVGSFSYFNDNQIALKVKILNVNL